ncbi:hypothetical protein HK096_011101 [Nowakowskiella sp. JEL0078]|nr:hypothetical protein HK096_011101 [Nowakowskiella sp. JEL0078]
MNQTRSVTFQLSSLEDAIVDLRWRFPSADLERLRDFLLSLSPFSHVSANDFLQAFSVSTILLNRSTTSHNEPLKSNFMSIAQSAVDGLLPADSSPSHEAVLPADSSSSHETLLPVESSPSHKTLLPVNCSPLHKTLLPVNCSPSHKTLLPVNCSPVDCPPSHKASLPGHQLSSTASPNTPAPSKLNLGVDSVSSFPPSVKENIRSPDQKIRSDYFSESTAPSTLAKPINSISPHPLPPFKTHLESVEWWKSKGNKNFQSSKFDDARSCYSRALQQLNCENLLSTFLHNLSSTYFHLFCFDKSLRCAFASIAVAPSAKAYYRAAKALQRMPNCLPLALWCATEAEGLEKFKDISDLVVQLRQAHTAPLAPDIGVAVLKLAVISPTPALDDVKDWDEVNRDTANLDIENDPAMLKQLANIAFKAGHMDKALGLYLKGISVYAGPATTLFNYITACYLKQGTRQSRTKAVLCASAALVLDPYLLVSFHRSIMALRDLGWLVEWKYMLDCAFSIFPDDAMLQRLKRDYLDVTEMKKVQFQSFATLTSPPSDLFFFNQDADVNTGWKTLEDDSMNARQKIITLLGYTSDNFDLTPPLPILSAEFAALELPATIDKSAWKEKLDEAYLFSRSLGWIEKALVDSRVCGNDILASHAQMFVGRTCGYLGEVSNWLSNPEAPNVKFWGREINMTREVTASFSRLAHQGMVLMAGTTHVAFEFCDLGELASSIILCEPKSPPLKWIGYDESDYSVAKTAVIVQMIEMNATVDEIIQVWYSSTWTKATYIKFNDAVAAIFKNYEMGSILTVLKAWHNFTIDLKSAYNKWFSSIHHILYRIPNFTSAADRAAVLRYLATGELFPGDVGNITMFQPLNKLHDESILQTIKPELLINRTTDIITAAIGVLRERVDNLKTAIRNRTLLINVNVGNITPYNGKFHAKIKLLEPHTMFWGTTIFDTLDPVDFAIIARACSNVATVHYFASVRWAIDVKGAWTLDYVSADVSQRVEIVTRSLERLDRVIREGERKPIVESAMLRVDYVLRDLCVQRWIEEVLKIWDIGDSQVAWWVPAWSMASRTNSELFMFFTFDEKLVLN